MSSSVEITLRTDESLELMMEPSGESMSEASKSLLLPEWPKELSPN